MLSKFQRLAEIIGIVLVTVCMVLIGFLNREYRADGAGEKTAGTASLNFWYSKEQYQPYFEEAAEAFEKETGIKVELHLLDNTGYVDKIEAAVIAKEPETADVFLTENKMLSELYLKGIAEPAREEFFEAHKGEYSETAYNSVQSHDCYAAYPLGFDTSIFFCNTNANTVEVVAEDTKENKDVNGIPAQVDTVEKTVIPETFEDILEFADSFDGMNGVENVFKWDVSNVFINYFFTGAYMNIGGATGEEETLDIANEKSLQAMQYFKNLKEYFALDASNIAYDEVVDEFADGKTVFMVARTDAIKTIEKKNAQKRKALSDGDAKEEQEKPVEYKVIKIPGLNEELQTSPMSETSAIVVNAFSDKKELAKQFAEFVSYDCADTLYDKTGIFSTRICNAQNSENIKAVYEQYEASVPMPKSKLADTILLRLEAAFTNIWLAETKGTATDDTLEFVVEDVVKKEVEKVENSLTGLLE